MPSSKLPSSIVFFFAFFLHFFFVVALNFIPFVGMTMCARLWKMDDGFFTPTLLGPLNCNLNDTYVVFRIFLEQEGALEWFFGVLILNVASLQGWNT